MRRHLVAVLVGAYDAAMKEGAATFRALRSDMEARKGEAVLGGTAKLADLFDQMHGFWASRSVPAAAALAIEAGHALASCRPKAP